MAKKMGLGRGLSAILPDVEEVVESVDQVSESAAPVPADAVAEIPVGDIDPNRNQPRKKFDDDALLALAESIRHNGVISPILVARDNGRYTIIAGERRYRAAKIAGKTQIPVVVRAYTDREIKEISLIENLQREDLNPIEAANAMKQLMDEYHLTQEELAERIGKSRPAVTNTLRLLSLTPEVIDLVSSGRLSAGHARALVTLPEDVQYKLASDAIKDGLSVRDIERSVRDFFASPEELEEKKEKKKQQVSIELKDLIERMRHTFKTKVSLIGNDRKGRIYIDYYNTDDLDRISEIVDRVDKMENK
mgnify:CR=1 FL=1